MISKLQYIVSNSTKLRNPVNPGKSLGGGKVFNPYTKYPRNTVHGCPWRAKSVVHPRSSLFIKTELCWLPIGWALSKPCCSLLFVRCDCKPKGMRSRPAQKWDIPCFSVLCIGPRSFRLSQVESEEDRMLICSSARISRNSAHVPEAGTCLVCSVHVWHMSRVKSLFWSRQAWSHVVSSVFWKTLRLSAVIQLSPSKQLTCDLVGLACLPNPSVSLPSCQTCRVSRHSAKGGVTRCHFSISTATSSQ